MVDLTRRGLLGSTALLAPTFLVACSDTSSISGVVSALPQWAQDVSNIAAAIQAYFTTLPQQVSGGIASTVSAVASIAGQIANAANGPISGVISGLIQQFSGLVSSILPAVGGTSALAGLGTFGTILQTALQLLPTILSIAGVALAPAGVGDPRAIAAARAYLAQIAHPT